MNEFLSQITSQLGIGESEGRSATGGLLALIKDSLDQSTFGAILDKLPGADALMGEADTPDSAGGGGGLLGSLTEAAGSLLGENAGGVASLIKLLNDSGISIDKAGGFLAAFVTFLKDKLGDDLFSTVTASLPALLDDADK